MNINKLNNRLQEIGIDYLYHLGLDSSMELEKMFGDIKYVVFTRSNNDADYFANQLTSKLYGLQDIKINCSTIAKDERYHIFKIANTLIISHGVGSPSLLICINEVIKLLWHAKAINPKFIRISPGGGIGVPVKELIISNTAVNHNFISQWDNIEFGKTYSYDSSVDDKFLKSFTSFSSHKLQYGKILATKGFYNGQWRLNGALNVNYTKEESDDYLEKAQEKGIKGIDMESGCFFAICKEFEIPAITILETASERLKNEHDADIISNYKQISIQSHIQKASAAVIDYIIKS
ncbi:MAG: hypothetical protein PHC75_02630 [Burkholderiales bacterium]|nr:hypothetical protein [Burkholderiales bacterium]